MSEIKHRIKEFLPTSWAIDNKTSIYVLAALISILGMMNYVQIPKEQFPQVVIPYIIVNAGMDNIIGVMAVAELMFEF